MLLKNSKKKASNLFLKWFGWTVFSWLFDRS